MFTEFMFSPSPADDEPKEQVSRSSVFGAAGVAWVISLVKLVLALAHHETGLDPTLAGFAAAAIPWMMLALWRHDDSRSTSLPMKGADEVLSFPRRSPSVGHLRRVSQ